MTIKEWLSYLQEEEFVKFVEEKLVSQVAKERERYLKLINKVNLSESEKDWRLFSSPGRCEIIGNHTDHQLGCVIGASVNVDSLALVCECDEKVILDCEGFGLKEISLTDLDIKPEEKNTSESILRGMLSIFKQKGYKVGGFKGYSLSSVLPGSGISSSASFELLIAQILNCLYNHGSISPLQLAKIAQEVENIYFGKPCGLADQTAIACGDLTFMDFKNKSMPAIKSYDFSFKKFAYSLVLINTEQDHASLSAEYGLMPQEMKEVAHYFNKDVLREVDEKEFMIVLPKMLKHFDNDRALLRAIHYYGEEKRVHLAIKALIKEDVESLLALMLDSGNSSYKYLQNAYVSGDYKHQRYALILALCERLLNNQGICKVHGGGLAGTILVIVKDDYLNNFKQLLKYYLGKDCLQIMHVRKVGTIEIKP